MHPGKIQRFLTEEKLAWLIVVFGIFLRLRQYLFNRSLWFDEAVIAIKLSSYSIPELTRPAATSMAQSVTSPLGFILIEKFFINIFGNNEFSLRLFPFFCGVISLILFKQIIQWLLRKEGRLLALWLFSSIHYLVYYSSEVKHYSSDILVALLLYTLFRQIWMKSLRAYDFLTCGMSGVVALLFSHVAAFILGG